MNRLLLAAFLCIGAVSQASSQVAPSKHTLMVGGQPLALWEKRAEHPKGAIVLIHGRTWSTLPDFDLQVPGESESLMDALVARGYSVYGLDLPGYGASPRDPSGWNTPDGAVDDASAALVWVAGHAGAPGKPALLGWSNGATVAALTAQRHPEQLSMLILTGYWKHPDSTIATDPDTARPLHQRTTAADAASDFIAPGAMSKRAIDAYVAAALKADPVRTDWHHAEQWNAIDPAKLTTPTLLIRGELDPTSSTAVDAAFFSRLPAADRAFVVIAGGDHTSLLGKTQPAFVGAVVTFLEGSHRPR